jgi:hypothetical protein
MSGMHHLGLVEPALRGCTRGEQHASTDIAFSPSVKAVQERRGSRGVYARLEQNGGWETKIDAVLANGGGGHVGGGGGPAYSGGGGGGGPGVSGGGGGRGFARGGGGPSLGGVPRGARSLADNGPGHVYSSSRSYAGRDFNRSGPRGDVRRGNTQAFNHDRGHDHGDRNRPDHRRFAERDRDHGHDFDHHGRHRVFRNGVWVWVYGPDYYAYGDDCWWLRRQALATGSPYWWSRYNACISYY